MLNVQHFALASLAWPDVGSCRQQLLADVARNGHVPVRDQYVDLGSTAAGALVVSDNSTDYLTASHYLCTVSGTNVYFLRATAWPNDNDAGVLTELLSFRP